MSRVCDVTKALNELAPFALQESWDNSGFLVGDPNGEVKTIFVALDITDASVEEAVEAGADLIVSHHPILFRPAKRVTADREDLVGKKLWTLARKGISAICCHTDLDVVEGGVNTALAETLGLQNIDQLCPEGTAPDGSVYGIGRVGTLEKPESLPAFLTRVRAMLGSNGLRYVDGGRAIQKVAVGGGACGDLFLDAVHAGCDAFVTSDVKYNQFLDASELGLTLIDAGHFPTERVVLEPLAAYLRDRFPECTVCISKQKQEVIRYFL